MGRIKCFCATTWLHANRASGIKALQGTVASFQFVVEFFSPTSSPRVTGLLSLSLGTVTTQVGHHKADGSFFLLGGEAGNYIVMYNYSYSNCNSIEITKGKAVHQSVASSYCCQSCYTPSLLPPEKKDSANRLPGFFQEGMLLPPDPLNLLEVPVQR